MRFVEFASPEDQLALWRVISDAVWASFNQQMHPPSTPAQSIPSSVSASAAPRAPAAPAVPSPAVKEKSGGLPKRKSVRTATKKIPRLPKLPVIKPTYSGPMQQQRKVQQRPAARQSANKQDTQQPVTTPSAPHSGTASAASPPGGRSLKSRQADLRPIKSIATNKRGVIKPVGGPREQERLGSDGQELLEPFSNALSRLGRQPTSAREPVRKQPSRTGDRHSENG